MAIQFLSKKDRHAKLHDIMWLKQKKEKRKLAKQKYRYSGLDPSDTYIKEAYSEPARVRGLLSESGVDTVGEPQYIPDFNKKAFRENELREQEAENQRAILESQGVSTVYRRTHSKKRHSKKLAKQKHRYDGFEGPGEARDTVHQSKKEIINQIGQITGKSRTNQEPNVDYFRRQKKAKIVWFRNKKERKK